MPILTLPLALLGLIALPTVAAIYYLRSRSKRRVVSSLIFWLEHQVAREGGRKLDRIQTPLLLLLELLILALIVLAAAGPRALLTQDALPLAVILDDSYSMRAGVDATARDRALTALKSEIASNTNYQIRFILAGERPRALDQSSNTARGDLDRHLADRWRCLATQADLPKAVALAGELVGEYGRILVLTDHPPKELSSDGRVQWWSFGQAAPNVAFVTASRDRHDMKHRVLLEVANFSTQSVNTRVNVRMLSQSAQPLNTESLSLEAGQRRQIILETDATDAPLDATLEDDALKLDNTVTLMAPAETPVNVELNVADADLSQAISTALTAIGGAKFGAAPTHLTITDREPQPQTLPQTLNESPAPAANDTATPETNDVETPKPWRLHFSPEGEVSSYVGPFVVDRTHPLTRGLNLVGLAWGAGGGGEAQGRAVITVGDLTLVSHQEDLNGRQDIHVRLNTDKSTVQRTPNWPIFLYNVLAWRREHLPGLPTRNYRLGSMVTMTPPRGVQTVRVIRPDGERRDVEARAGRATIEATDPGLHELQAGQLSEAYAVNVLDANESSLAGAATLRLGDWNKQEDLLRDYQSIAWLLLVIAATLLTLHMFLAAKASKLGGSAS